MPDETATARSEIQQQVFDVLSGGKGSPPRDPVQEWKAYVAALYGKHKLLPALAFIENCRATPDSTRQQFERHREWVMRDWVPLLSIDWVLHDVRVERRRLSHVPGPVDDFGIRCTDFRGPKVIYEITACETLTKFVAFWIGKLPRRDAPDQDIADYLHWLSAVDLDSTERCQIAAQRELEVFRRPQQPHDSELLNRVKRLLASKPASTETKVAPSADQAPPVESGGKSQEDDDEAETTVTTPTERAMAFLNVLIDSGDLDRSPAQRRLCELLIEYEGRLPIPDLAKDECVGWVSDGYDNAAGSLITRMKKRFRDGVSIGRDSNEFVVKVDGKPVRK